MTEQGFTKEESAPGALASADAVRGTSAHPAHTPGPWEARLYADTWTVRAVYVSPAGLRTTSWPATVACGGEPNEANARLIAAAPELLEALKHIADPEMMRGEWVGDEIVYRWIGATDFQDIAKAAIAKAEGRQ